MRFRRAAFLALVALSFPQVTSNLFGADDLDLPPIVSAVSTLQDEKTAPGTLPPIEVRPPQNNTPPAPPTDVDDSYFTPSPAVGNALSFPSLSDQVLGGALSDLDGLNSATRGSKSLFEHSSFGTIVDQNSLREKQSTDMFRALQNEPGVLMQSTGRGQASPFLRGVTGQQTLVMVDGVRVNNQTFRSGPNQYFNTIDPGQVERIEVIRGGGSVLWGGDAIGGVINIVTRGADNSNGNYLGSSFGTTFSTADTAWYGRANVEGWSGRSGLFAGASYMAVNDVDIGGSFGRQPFTHYDQYAGDVKYNFMVTDEQIITVMLSHFEQSNVPRSDRFAPFVLNARNGVGAPVNSARPTFFDPQQRDMGYIRWQGYAFNENAAFDTFSVTSSYSRTKEGLYELRSATQLDTGEFTNDVFGFTMSLQKDLDAFGIVTYGTDYYHDDIDSRKTRRNPVTNVLAGTQPNPQFPNDAYADRIGAFWSWDVQLTDRLNAVVGTRYENVDLHATPRYTVGGVPTNIHFDRTYQEWVASIGLNYTLTEEWKLVGGVYEGFRAPTMDDLAASTTFLQNAAQDPVLASLGVQPEHSYTYEIGTKYNGDNFRLQLYEWWMTIDDYITRRVDGVGNVFLGNSDAYLNGTELAGEYLFDGGWSLYGNFTYTYGKDRGNRVPYTRIPPMQGILGVRWRDDSRRNFVDVYTWMVDRVDRQDNNPNAITDSRFWVSGRFETPGYATLNMRCGTALGENQNHRLTLNLENITDQFYRVLGSGVNGTGFNAIFGYEYLR